MEYINRALYRFFGWNEEVIDEMLNEHIESESKTENHMDTNIFSDNKYEYYHEEEVKYEGTGIYCPKCKFNLRELDIWEETIMGCKIHNKIHKKKIRYDCPWCMYYQPWTPDPRLPNQPNLFVCGDC